MSFISTKEDHRGKDVIDRERKVQDMAPASGDEGGVDRPLM
jgi:hypothetical protein